MAFIRMTRRRNESKDSHHIHHTHVYTPYNIHIFLGHKGTAATPDNLASPACLESVYEREGEGDSQKGRGREREREGERGREQ
jgi:hypothetical protein